MRAEGGEGVYRSALAGKFFRFPSCRLKISPYNLASVRGVAQPGSALAWGARGREFESRRPDQTDYGSVLTKNWPVLHWMASRGPMLSLSGGGVDEKDPTHHGHPLR